MRTLDCQRLPVVDAHGVIGLCDRGVLQSSQRRGNWMGSVSVGDLMRRGPFWCRVLDPSEKVLRTMERLSTDVLAVIDQRGAIVGIVHRDQLTATHSSDPRQPCSELAVAPLPIRGMRPPTRPAARKKRAATGSLPHSVFQPNRILVAQGFTGADLDQLERTPAGIDELVPCAAWDGDALSGLQADLLELLRTCASPATTSRSRRGPDGSGG